jgi:6-phosphofructokinase
LCWGTCCAVVRRHRSIASSDSGFGAAAVRALESGQNGVMVALDPPDVVHVPLAEATRHLKNVPPECDTMLTARDLRINFGDRMPEISP